MEKTGITRREIEEKIAKVGDYVRMDYLSACLKKGLDFDTRKFVLNKLSTIYESRGMFTEAGKLMRASADINTTFDAKTSDFMKSFDLFVRGGNFDEAEVSFTKALAVANQRQKEELKVKRKQLYHKQAEDYSKKDRRKHAALAYEKLLTLELTADERKRYQTALMALYEKLGKVREFYNMKKNIESPTQPVQSQTGREQRKDYRDVVERNTQSVDDILRSLNDR